MPFDGIVLSSVRAELEKSLTGSRIEKIYQPTGNEVHLLLSKPGGRFRLLLCADPGMARVHLTSSRGENPSSPPVFCMVLRKYLEGSRITGFFQPDLDRVLKIRTNSRDDLGRSLTVELICEIMGRHSNIILVNSETGIILDGIKRYSHEVSRHREVLPGLPYIPPPAQNKLNPTTITEDDFNQVVLANSLSSRVASVIQQLFDGISPLAASEIVWQAGLDLDATLDYCGQFELRGIFMSLRELYRRSETMDFQPTAVWKGDKPLDYSAFPLTHIEGSRREYTSMNELLDSFYFAKTLQERLSRARQTIISTVGKDTARLDKKLSLQTESIADAGKSEVLRLTGELITANIHRLKKGDREVCLENFYEEDAPAVKITLDPRLSPAENAQRYFRQYSKAKSTLEAASRQAAITSAELDYLGGVAVSAENALTMEEIEEIRQELVEQGYIRPVPQKGRKAPGIPGFTRPPSYRSSDGFLIYTGRNNRQNDLLTQKLASPDDVWLHTREIPGSHVIIKTGGQPVPDRTLLEAANLAALFSKARNSRKVPVDYTLRKFVRKPRGSRPGFVNYTDFRTIIVDPDHDLPESLSRPEDG